MLVYRDAYKSFDSPVLAGVSLEVRRGERLAAVVEFVANTAARRGINAGRLALAGDSAGANLAIGAALDLREHRPGLIKALLLFYGVYGADLETASYCAFGDGRFGLSRADMAAYWDAYAPRPADREDRQGKPFARANGGAVARLEADQIEREEPENRQAHP